MWPPCPSKCLVGTLITFNYYFRKDPNRYVTVTRRQPKHSNMLPEASFDISSSAQQHMVHLMQQCPLTSKEKQDLLIDADSDRYAGFEGNARCFLFLK